MSLDAMYSSMYDEESQREILLLALTPLGHDLGVDSVPRL